VPQPLGYATISCLLYLVKKHSPSDKLKIVKPSDAEITAEQTAQEIDTESTERATNFSFTKCQIPVGSKITYCNDPNITAKVVDDRNVEYNGETMSLTALAKLLTGKKYSIAGPKFFKYNGEWLNDIRHKLGV